MQQVARHAGCSDRVGISLWLTRKGRKTMLSLLRMVSIGAALAILTPTTIFAEAARAMGPHLCQETQVAEGTMPYPPPAKEVDDQRQGRRRGAEEKARVAEGDRHQYSRRRLRR